MQRSKSREGAIDLVPSAEYPVDNVESEETETAQRLPSSLDISSLESRSFQSRNPRGGGSVRSYSMLSSEGETFAKSFRGVALPNGETDVNAMLQTQVSHPFNARPGISDKVQGAGYDGYRGSQDNANYNQAIHQIRLRASVSEGSRSKLRWQPRDPDMTDEWSAPAVAGSGSGDNLTGDGHERHPDRGSEIVSTGSAMERHSGAPGPSRRESEDRRSLDEHIGVGQQLPHSPSDESVGTSDMYDPTVSVGEYEPSETSSTTWEEGDDGIATSRSIGRHSPLSESGVSRSVVRPNPRSNASTTSGRNIVSEESYASQMEQVSPDGHYGIGPRRHSWDEGLEPSRTSVSASSLGAAPGAMSVRHRLPSSEHGPRESLVRVSSEPPVGSRTSRAYNYHDTARQPLPSALRPNPQHQQWPNPTSYSSLRGSSGNRSSSNSSRSHFGEPSPMHPLQSGPTFPLRQPGRLPPRPGQFPPLPPRGALQRVYCQHCDIQLLVPSKLPPTKTSIQKLRCGSCKRISQFSVSHGEDLLEFPLSAPDSHHGHSFGRSLLASSPPAEAGGGIASLGSGNGFSASESNDGYFLPAITRQHSTDDARVSSEEMTDVSLPEAGMLGRDSSWGSERGRLENSTHGQGGSERVLDKSAWGSHSIERTASGEAVLTSNDADHENANATAATSSQSESPHHPASPPPQKRAIDHGLHDQSGIGILRMLRTRSRQAGSSQYRRRVSVNGVSIPDHLVKKAEEQAGDIHPGSYWYDSLAGFWGVVGGPCMGIIPQFIQEFNYPMSRDCAGGRTGILVNGRELHHKDREKLASRGFPTSGGTYRVDIDGKVFDAITNASLPGLGRLAPSLERSRRGAGMKVPASLGGGRG